MSSASIRPLLLATLAVALWQDPGLVETSTNPRVDGLVAARNGDRVVASFRVVNAFHEDTIDKIQSGIPVTFKHRVRVVAKRGLPLLPAKEIGRTRVDTRAIYDALTGQYSLTRETVFRSKKDVLAPVEEARKTTSEAEMRRWMTEIDEVSVYDPDPEAEEPLTGQKVRVRVDSNLGRRFVLLVIPATRGDEAEIPLEP